MLPVVIVQVRRQKDEVRRLSDYCLDLDGTEITVLKASKEAEQHMHPGDGYGASLCFEQAMHEFQGEPFFWLEADAIPLKPGWREPIEQEYREAVEAGKKFVLPSLEGLDKHDWASAIGVYPADAIDIIPHGLRVPRLWDLWLYQELPNDIFYTRLIQHSYMNYAQWRPWRFPADRHIIRHDALLFHRDMGQTLIGEFYPEEYYRPAPSPVGGINRSTSAGNHQRNLSTSAELFTDDQN
jgi:hypothetical protein